MYTFFLHRKSYYYVNKLFYHNYILYVYTHRHIHIRSYKKTNSFS